MTAQRAEQIRARRKITKRIGLATIVMMTALTACIFDQGNYQGGGRKDNGGSSQTASSTGTTTPTDTTTSPTGTATDDAADQSIPGFDAADANAE